MLPPTKLHHHGLNGCQDNLLTRLIVTYKLQHTPKIQVTQKSWGMPRHF